jgi:methyl-accepting chemotaxis protein
MKDLRLAYKLLVGFGIVLVLTGIVAGVGIFGLNWVGVAADNASKAEAIVKQVLEIRRQEKNFILRGFEIVEGDTLNAVERLNEHVDELEVQLADIRTHVADEEMLKLVDQTDQNVASYKAEFSKFVDLERVKLDSEAKMVAAALEVIETIDAMRSDQQTKFQTEMEGDAQTNALLDRWQKSTDANTLAQWFLDVRRIARNYMLSHQQADVDAVDAQLAEMVLLLEDLKVRFNDAANDAQVDAILDRLQFYQGSFNTYVDAIDQQAAQEATLIRDARAVQQTGEQLRAAEHESMEAAQQLTLMLILGSSILALVVGIVAAWLITRTVTRPINQLQRVTEQMAAGDLNVQIEVVSKDEIGVMMAAFQRMVAYLREMARAADTIAERDLSIEITPQSEADQLGISFQKMAVNLRETLTELQKSAETIASATLQLSQAAEQSGQATQQIALTMDQVAQGTAQQASGIERTRQIVAEQSRAIAGIANGAQYQAEAVEKAQQILDEQLTRSIQQVNETAEQSEQFAIRARAMAQTGAESVRKTIEGMQTIAKATQQVSHSITDMLQRSQEVSTIVQTIDEIAERTNLLALNAAIEAARAGEHGRGFAVVADEVRKLAEQSARSAREITGLIKTLQVAAHQASSSMEHSSRDVDHGVSLAAGAEQGLEQIQSVVTDMGQQMELLASAVDQMSESRVELSNTMVQVVSVVEENTASTEELAASSDQVLMAVEEVAAVSEQNSAAAEEVSASTEEVSAQVDETAASVGMLSELAQALRELTGQFRLNKDSTDIAQQIVTFKAAHMRWVERVEGMVNTGKSIPPKELVSHTECALGRWYTGIAKHEFGHLAEFQRLDAPHARLHQLAREAASNCESGNSAALMRNYQEIKRASAEVVAILDQLLSQITSGGTVEHIASSRTPAQEPVRGAARSKQSAQAGAGKRLETVR